MAEHRRGPLRREEVRAHKHRDSATRLPWHSTLSPAQQEARKGELRGKLVRAAELGEQLEALQAQLDVLRTDIKQHLLAGDYVESDQVYPELRLGYRTGFAYGDFLQAFGPELTAQCAVIQVKQVEHLIVQGRLKAEVVRPLRKLTPAAPSLQLVKKEGEER